jgi:chromosomal replication initiator protein
MSLDHFIPSEQTLVAHQILKDPTEFNPIYLFGKTGSGKTHLLMGTALHLKKMGKKTMYIKAETFTGHVVQAMRLGQMQEFRKVYRDIDALLIDDIHIFSKKAATQEEFFHTFNTLHIAGKLIVISSHLPPSKLNEIEPRLISRFEWGISLEVGISDPLPIICQKAALWKVQLTPEMTEWIITQFPKNPVMALQALVFRSKGDLPSCDIATKLLKDLLAKESENALTAEKIIKKIAAHHGITTDDILGKAQMRNVAAARQLAMYFCRVKLQLPFQKIGEIFKRDHSTVMSSIKQVQKGIEEKTIEPPEIS